MTIKCDLCEQAVEDSMMKIVEQGNEILYSCPDCYARSQEASPEEQA